MAVARDEAGVTIGRVRVPSKYRLCTVPLQLLDWSGARVSCEATRASNEGDRHG
jgi:hypothetical protein